MLNRKAVQAAIRRAKASAPPEVKWIAIVPWKETVTFCHYAARPAHLSGDVILALFERKGTRWYRRVEKKEQE